ncbi:MAG: hypothetical protein ACYC8S_01625 [Minisyncoccota bacterium]
MIEILFNQWTFLATVSALVPACCLYIAGLPILWWLVFFWWLFFFTLSVPAIITDLIAKEIVLVVAKVEKDFARAIDITSRIGNNC